VYLTKNIVSAMKRMKLTQSYVFGGTRPSERLKRGGYRN